MSHLMEMSVVYLLEKRTVHLPMGSHNATAAAIANLQSFSNPTFLTKAFALALHEEAFT